MQHARHHVSVVTDPGRGVAVLERRPIVRFAIVLAAGVAVVVTAVAVDAAVSGPTNRTVVSRVPATSVHLVDQDLVEATPRQATGIGPHRWVKILERLDRRRRQAWSQGHPALLDIVFAAGTPELARDRASLQAYLERGLRVEGVSLRFAGVDVMRHRPGWVRLRVVDQLTTARTVTAGQVRGALPRDRPSRHRIDLRHGQPVGGSRLLWRSDSGPSRCPAARVPLIPPAARWT